MNDPFESPLFLCSWAKREAKQFREGAYAFVKSEPYAIVTEFNPETGEKEVKIKLRRPIPEELRGLASNTIKNLRDALDQAMVAATFVITGKRSRFAHFPFGESADDLENSLSLRKARICRDIPEELFPYIRRVMPYPHDADLALRALGRVAGPNKHEVTLLPAISSNEISGGTNIFGPGGGKIAIPTWDKDKEEMIIAAYPAKGHAKLDLQFPIFVALDIPAFEREPAAKFIDYSVARVTSIVNGLKNEAERIGANRATD